MYKALVGGNETAISINTSFLLSVTVTLFTLKDPQVRLISLLALTISLLLSVFASRIIYLAYVVVPPGPILCFGIQYMVT